jgi:surfactin synthase thioesterase subunit
MKIIAFPFAGGNKTSFNSLFQDSNIDFVTVNYPGRGARVRETLLTDINDLINDCMTQVLKAISAHEPYIIYGHSMGALVGFLVCKQLKKLGYQQPLKLVVSGHKAPKYPRAKKISHLPDDIFWEEVTRYGGMPDELAQYPDLIKFFIPIFKADFRTIEEYVHPQERVLNIPIEVFYGSDESITYQTAKEWELETTQGVSIHELPGDHFFIFKHKKAIHQAFMVKSTAY